MKKRRAAGWPCQRVRRFPVPFPGRGTACSPAVAPFIGVLLSFLAFREIPGVLFFIALAMMVAGTWLVNRE